MKIQNPKLKPQNKFQIPNPKNQNILGFEIGNWDLFGILKFGLGILLALVISSSSFAASSTGTTVGSFLKLNSGVRAAAMGNAFVAIADDPSAIYFNPAGLAKIKPNRLSSEYASWLSGISYTNLSFIKPFDNSSAAGIAANYLDLGEIEETTIDQPSGTGRIFRSQASMITAAYATKINPILSLGISANLLNENIDTSEANGYAATVGALFNLSPKFSVGLAARNIGAFTGIDNPLPLTYVFGISYRPENYLTLASDVNIPNDNEATIHLGAEYNYNDILFLRAGYNSRSEDSAGGNVGLGAGFKWQTLHLDYAYVPYGDLGNTYRVSIDLSF